jgi:beta-phosphoglucomutase
VIKSVIFDMDGVLIDAREWHYEALNRALDKFGFTITRVEHLTTYDGLPTKRKLELLSQTGSLPLGLHGFINNLKQVYTMEIINTRCKPRFGQEYALARLRNEGYRLAVASNSITETVRAMMRRSHLEGYLDAQISAQDVARGKPDPDIYHKAMAAVGTTPEETLVVEDNENGIKAATAAGAHLLVVEDPDDVTYAAIAARIAEIEEAAR